MKKAAGLKVALCFELAQLNMPKYGLLNNTAGLRRQIKLRPRMARGKMYGSYILLESIEEVDIQLLGLSDVVTDTG